ncbi:MAG: hypothetical protein HC912_06295 [Saprospiraceae bacterium]|nr:hypothetical protein [Saprospiraceae bacterium]
MARINQGILGGLSGKIANVVGGAWKGINYLRSLPVSVANPRTTPQVNQRNKLKTAVRLAKQILAGWIKPLWDRFAIEKSGYNAWVSENIANLDADGIVNTGDAILSKGVMSAVEGSGTYNATTGELEVDWPTALPDSQSSASDIPYLAVYNLDTKNFIFSGALAATRSTGTATVTIATSLSLADINFWLAFRSADGRKVSGSTVSGPG